MKLSELLEVVCDYHPVEVVEYSCEGSAWRTLFDGDACEVDMEIRDREVVDVQSDYPTGLYIEVL